MDDSVKAVDVSSSESTTHREFLPVKVEERDYEIERVKLRVGLLEFTSDEDGSNSRLLIDGQEMQFVTSIDLSIDCNGDNLWRAKVGMIVDPRVVKK